MSNLSDVELEISALKTQLATLRSDLDAALKNPHPAAGNSTGTTLACDTLNCRKIQLLDDKDKPAAIFENDEYGPVLRLFDRDGRRRLTLRVKDGRGGLTILDEETNPIVQAFADAGGHGQVAVSSPGGITRAGLRATDSGGVVSVVNAEGVPRAVMHSCDGGGEVIIFDDQHELVKLGATKDGGTIGTRDSQGQRACILISAEASNSILVYRPDGSEAVTLIGAEGAGAIAVGSDDTEAADGEGAFIELFALKGLGGRITVRDKDRKLAGKIEAATTGGEVTLHGSDEQELVKLETSGNGGAITLRHQTPATSAVRLAAGENAATILVGRGGSDEMRGVILSSDDKHGGTLAISEGAHTSVALGRVDEQGKSASLHLTNSDNTCAARLAAHTGGGLLQLSGADGVAQIVASARESGGALSVYNELGVERGRLQSLDDGGSLHLRWGGTPGVVAAATEKGGRIVLGDDQGKTIAKLPDEEWRGEESED